MINVFKGKIPYPDSGPSYFEADLYRIQSLFELESINVDSKLLCELKQNILNLYLKVLVKL